MKSMTGFATHKATFAFGEVHIEIQTVNSRYVECHTRLPSALSALELAIKQKLKSRLSRGKCECVIRLDKAQTHVAQVDEAMLLQLLTSAKKLQSTHPDIALPTWGELLSLPNVVSTQAPDLAELTEQLFDLLDSTMDQLIARRREEGAHLATLIESRLAQIEDILVDARENYQSHARDIETQLREKVTQLRVEIDEARFEQELVYLLQKSDIDEEFDRLTGHVQAVRELLKKDEPIGRKLDFLMQELNREANTIGSKSHRLALTNDAIELKVLIEQIREQVQNIE